MKPPCTRSCPHRSPGCGASCEKWQEYVKARDDEYKRREMQRKIIGAKMDGYIRCGGKKVKQL